MKYPFNPLTLALPLLENGLPILSLDDTLGAIYIGNLVAGMVYALTSVQIYYYYGQSGSRDGPLLRTLIFILWMLATWFLICSTIYVYYYGVTEYGNVLAAFEPAHWSAIVTCVLAGISDTIVRSIFLWRIYIFTKLKWFTIIMAVNAFGILATFIAYAILIHTSGSNLVLHLNSIEWVMDMTYALAMVEDIAFSVVLSISLMQRRRTALVKTDRIVKTLMTYAINTGVLVSMVAVAQLLTAALIPRNLIFEAIFFVSPGLYVNSLLATLNARDRLRQQSTGVVTIHSSRLVTRIAGDPEMEYQIEGEDEKVRQHPVEA